MFSLKLKTPSGYKPWGSIPNTEKKNNPFFFIGCSDTQVYDNVFSWLQGLNSFPPSCQLITATRLSSGHGDSSVTPLYCVPSSSAFSVFYFPYIEVFIFILCV